MDKIIAIYVRRSVSDSDKGNNSLSIAAQQEECVKYVKEHFEGSEFKVYCDDGKSGKDIAHRPAFQEMVLDVKNGFIGKIIVKKYDRFSRNMREYLNITDELDGYGVGVISLSEPFNTETKEGRMMRNNLLNFAEFERETIAARVADAFSTKARETGFYQGGKMYYGYISSRQTINGKTGSVLVPSPQAKAVEIAYRMYAEPDVSLQDVIDHFRKSDINTIATYKNRETKPLDRGHLSRLLKSPLYVKADTEVYRYFADKGVEILDDITAYDGVHGLLLHEGTGGQYIKVGYHEGLVEPSVWLAVQDKKTHNKKIPSRLGAAYTWLGGLVKCAHCGYALCIQHGNRKQVYYRDRGAYTVKGCVRKTLKTRPRDVEAIVLSEMKEHLKQFEVAKRKKEKPSAEVAELTRNICAKETEIEGLMSKLALADDEMTAFIFERVKRLKSETGEYKQKLRMLQSRQKDIDTTPLSGPLSRWEELTVDEKHAVAVKMINVIRVSDETGIDIEFSF